MTELSIDKIPVRELIDGLRKKASELSEDHLISVLFSSAVVNRLEEQADLADAHAKKSACWERKYTEEAEKVRILLECKPAAEALEQIADMMHAMKAPADYIRSVNLWADAVRKADGLIGSTTGEGE